VCFVPERREERTTEGGLDVIGQYPTIHAAAHKLMDAGIRVSLFIAPCLDQIQKAIDMHIPVIEIHTGHYAELEDEDLRKAELQHIKKAIDFAVSHGLVVNAGHGLHYENVQEIAAIKGIDELNIGHAIVAEALFVGWEHAIKRMRAIITEVSGS